MSKSHELYKKYRPDAFNDVFGQSAAVNTLRTLLKGKRFPHTLIFTGPSGVGKTTLARILKSQLSCWGNDFFEINAAEDRGIDLVRKIQRFMGLAPLSGKCKIYLIDEAHQLTTQAQDAFLKILEDTPQHVYFMLCTTDPKKLKNTIRTRSTEVNLKAVDPKALGELLYEIAELEDFELDDSVADRIIDYSQGSPRKALVYLNQVAAINEVEDQLEAIQSSIEEKEAIEIARQLLKPKPSWKDIAGIIKQSDENAESIRRMILGYMESVLLKGGKLSNRAAHCLQVFGFENLNDSGRPGLTYMCYEITSS